MRGASESGIAVNRPVVASETIGDETIILHHGNGHYFDTSGVGSLIWNAIEGGTSVERLTRQIAAGYAIDEAAAQRDVAAFVDMLIAHDLVRTGAPEADAAEIEPASGVIAANGAYGAPRLGVHTDLADMLLLDPIHEVSEAGWPIAAPAASPGAG